MQFHEAGQFMRLRRQELGVTQVDLAEMSGTTARTIFDIESGQGNPSLKTILALLEVLGIELCLKIKTVDQ